MFKKSFCLLTLILVSLSISATSININYNLPSSIESEVKNSVKGALSKSLSSRIVIDQDKTDVLEISVETLSYLESENSLSLYFVSKYKDKEFRTSVVTNKNKSLDQMLIAIEQKIYDAFKYDSVLLFGEKNNLNLNYYTPTLASFNFDKSETPKIGSYYYLENEAGEKKGLASINSLFESSATLNILYNSGITPSLDILKAPSGMLSLSSSYDYVNDNIYSSINYTLLHSFLPFLNKANLSFDGGFSYNDSLRVSALTLDIGLVMDLPLSLIFNSESLFKNSGIRVSTFGGTYYSDGFDFHSKYSIGYYFYFFSKYNFEIYLENNTLLFDDNASSSLNVGYKISILI